MQEAKEDSALELDIQAALRHLSLVQASNQFMANNFMFLAPGLLPALAHTAMATGMAHQFTDTD